MEYEIYKEKETFYEDYHGKILDRKQLKEAVSVMPEGMILCVSLEDRYDKHIKRC